MSLGDSLPRMPARPHTDPCTTEAVGMDNIVTFHAENRVGPACVICRHWVTEITTQQDRHRTFIHARAILREYK